MSIISYRIICTEGTEVKTDLAKQMKITDSTEHAEFLNLIEFYDF